jgi:hypothetical protein
VALSKYENGTTVAVIGSDCEFAYLGTVTGYVGSRVLVRPSDPTLPRTLSPPAAYVAPLCDYVEECVSKRRANR